MDLTIFIWWLCTLTPRLISGGGSLSILLRLSLLNLSRVNMSTQSIAPSENAYFFPLFTFIGPVLRFPFKAGVSLSIVVQRFSPFHFGGQCYLLTPRSIVRLVGKANRASYRIWSSAIPCPQCTYLNDAICNFYYRCGFRRENIPTPDSSSSVSVDLKTINDKIAKPNWTRSGKPYEKQKPSLQSELIGIIASLPIPKILPSATSSDILKSLV